MKYNNSTTYIKYTTRSDSSKKSNITFNSSKSDSFASVIKNKTLIIETTIQTKKNNISY